MALQLLKSLNRFVYYVQVLLVQVLCAFKLKATVSFILKTNLKEQANLCSCTFALCVRLALALLEHTPHNPIVLFHGPCVIKMDGTKYHNAPVQ